MLVFVRTGGQGHSVGDQGTLYSHWVETQHVSPRLTSSLLTLSPVTKTIFLINLLSKTPHILLESDK